MGTIGAYTRVAASLLRGDVVSPQHFAAGYDRVSLGYEEHFLAAMGSHNEAMLRELAARLPDVPRVVDVACGTGFNSRFLRDVVGGHYDLSDVSAGMLGIARVAMPEATFRQAEMLADLRSLPDACADAVVCGWAIKYSEPAKVAREMARVVGRGGYAAVIVNRRNTLPEIRAAFPRLIARHADALGPVLLDLPNPRGAAALARWFTDAGFEALSLHEGEEVFRFADGREAADWVTSTGALAGFDAMLDLCDEAVLQDLGMCLEASGCTLTHRFVWGVFGIAA